MLGNLEPDFSEMHEENAEKRVHEIKTMNELLGVPDVTLMGDILTPLAGSDAPFYPYLTKAMGVEWNRDMLQVFLDYSDRQGGYDITVISSDVMRFQLPNRLYLGDHMDSVAKRSMHRVERMLQRNQIQRSLRLMPITGYDDGPTVYIPSNVDKVYTFIPFDSWAQVHRELLDFEAFLKPVDSTMYEVFKNDGNVR